VFCLLALLEGRLGCGPGKWLCSIRVLGSDLRPCGFRRALRRNLRGLSQWSEKGLMALAVSEHWQHLGDIAAETVVLRAGARATSTGPSRCPFGEFASSCGGRYDRRLASEPWYSTFVYDRVILAAGSLCSTLAQRQVVNDAIRKGLAPHVESRPRERWRVRPHRTALRPASTSRPSIDWWTNSRRSGGGEGTSEPMIVPDINLLLYAEIDAFPWHSAARSWWRFSGVVGDTGSASRQRPMRLRSAAPQVFAVAARFAEG